MKSLSLIVLTTVISTGLMAQNTPQDSAFSPGTPPAFSLKATPPQPNWQSKFVDGIAAVVKVKVNEKDKGNTGQLIITCEDLRKEVAVFIPALRQEISDDARFEAEVQTLARQILQGRINRFLIEQDGRYMGMKIPDAYLKNCFEEVIANQFNGDRNQYMQFLKSNGLNDATFKSNLANDIMVDYLRSQKQKNATAFSPAAIQSYYESNAAQFHKPAQVSFSQILIKPENATQVPKVLEELKTGKDFKTVAKQYSQDDKASSGGDWGWLDLKDLRPELAQAVNILQPKQYTTQPVEINGSNFIIYINDKKPERIASFEEAAPKIEEILAAEAGKAAEEQWIRSLQEKASIQILI